MFQFYIYCDYFFYIKQLCYIQLSDCHKLLHLINLYNYVCVCVLYCGGHHDSDRMAVLVMVSQAEIIVL